MMLRKLTVTDFINELASNSPAPGGGSVAALSASLASALCSMVCSLTVGKKCYNELADDKKALIDDTLKVTDKFKTEFLEFMDKDADEFLKLMDAFKLPKNTDEEKAARSQKINEANIAVLNSPLETAKHAYEIYDYILIACNYGNKNAASDAGVAALLTQAAIEGAVLNVKINIPSIKDEKLVKEANTICDDLVKNGIKKRDEILAIVNSKING